MRGYDSYYDPPEEIEDYSVEPVREDFESDDEFEAYLVEWKAERQAQFAKWEQEALAEKTLEQAAHIRWLDAGQACKGCKASMTEADFYFCEFCERCVEESLTASYEVEVLESFVLIELDPRHPTFPTYLPDEEIVDE